MPTCLFGCDAPALTDEHIYSRAWIERMMPLPVGEKLKHTHERVKGQRPFKIDGREQFAVEWESAEAGLTVKGVCKACNGGWMDRMDHDTYPHIEPMVAGYSHTLLVSGQQQAARWSTKIAILFDTHLEHPALTPQLRARFRETGQPFADSHVWLGRYDLPWGTWKASGSPTTKSENPSAGDTNAYLCTLIINHLIVQVLVPLGGFDVILYARTMERAWGGHLRRIWPPLLGAGNVEWPPPRSVRPSEFPGFAAAEAAPGSR